MSVEHVQHVQLTVLLATVQLLALIADKDTTPPTQQQLLVVYVLLLIACPAIKLGTVINAARILTWIVRQVIVSDALIHAMNAMAQYAKTASLATILII